MKARMRSGVQPSTRWLQPARQSPLQATADSIKSSERWSNSRARTRTWVMGVDGEAGSSVATLSGVFAVCSIFCR